MDHFALLYAPAKVKITLDKASCSSYLGYELKKVRDERLGPRVPYSNLDKARLVGHGLLVAIRRFVMVVRGYLDGREKLRSCKWIKPHETKLSAQYEEELNGFLAEHFNSVDRVEEDLIALAD